MPERGPRGPGRARARAAAVAIALVLVALVGAGCALSNGGLDGPIGVNMHVSTTPTSVEVDAPGWFADMTRVYLCPVDPPFLPEPGPARVGWTPGPSCHDYGSRPSGDGLTASLPLADLSDADRAMFTTADDWYLLLLELDGDRVSTAVRSRFAAPDVAAGS